MKKSKIMTKGMICSLALGLLMTSLSPTEVLALNSDSLAITKDLTEYNMVRTYKNILKKNIDEVKEMVHDLGPQKKDAKKLQSAQEREQLLHAKYQKVLKEKNRKIFEYMKLTEGLKRGSKNTGFQARIDHELKKRNLSNDIESSDETLSTLKSDLYAKNLEIEFLNKMMNSRTTSLKKKVNHLNKKIKKLNTDFKYMAGKMVKELKSYKRKDIETINSLREKLAHNSLALAAAHTALPKSLNYKPLQNNDKHKELSSEISTLTNQLASLDTKYTQMSKKYYEQVKINHEVTAKATKLENGYIQKISMLEDNLAKSSSQILALQTEVRTNANTRGRFPASVPFEDTNETLKAELSKQIAQKIQEAKIGFLTEFNENNISITLDEKFFFNNDSSSINELGKEKLKTLISIYSKQLFQHEKIRERIKAVSFIGHASPRYNSKVLDPLDASEEAFQYNMELSTKRAQSVANLIFSPDFGKFEYKDTLRAKTMVSGRGFSTPIPSVKRNLASVGDTKCGSYDCRKSRRVEIIFELRDMENAKK